jgi:phenylacetate-CoA ligase
MPTEYGWSAPPELASRAAARPSGPHVHAEWETMAPDEREARLGERLAALVERAWREVPSLRRRFESGGLTPETCQGVRDLARLPVVERAWLVAQQHDHPPFGGWCLVPAERLRAVHFLPGPLRVPEAREPDYWRWGVALAAAGVERGALVIVEQSPRHTLAPMVQAGVAARDAVCGPVNPLDAAALESFGPWASEAIYAGTARGLEILLARVTPGVLRTAVLTRGAPSPSLLMRARRLHMEIFRAFGVPEIGCLGFECRPGAGLHLVPDLWVELLDPASGEPVADGQTGRLVVSRLDDVYPILRYLCPARGALTAEPCLCGRTTPRLFRFEET